MYASHCTQLGNCNAALRLSELYSDVGRAYKANRTVQPLQRSIKDKLVRNTCTMRFKRKPITGRNDCNTLILIFSPFRSSDMDYLQIIPEITPDWKYLVIIQYQSSIANVHISNVLCGFFESLTIERYSQLMLFAGLVYESSSVTIFILICFQT